ncbi:MULTISPECIES: plasmid mobilization protein [Rhodococcus erythropolis group]|uniref:IS sequence n=1 Tax=Rhodococcus erythropolis TaxID=1833 RepID=Q6XMU4_RHOER|nr:MULTISPECIES: hypothetical protein [Rhodococcus erythropolis group]AAP74087.1 IS sequence [Rhodococcus erythropolis]MCW0191166.1 hypothetical protein [Rhodococcus sp. (in: high G+C Gram-positive bacteria)]
MGHKLDAALAERVEIESAPDAEARSDVRVTRGHGRTRVLQVRLNADELAEMQARADQQGLPVSTVARTMLLDQLRADTDPHRLARDLHRLADMIDRETLPAMAAAGSTQVVRRSTVQPDSV